MAKTCLHIMLSDGGECCTCNNENHLPHAFPFPFYMLRVLIYFILFMHFLLLYSPYFFFHIRAKAKFETKTTCSSHVLYKIEKSHESHRSVCFSNMLFLMFSTEKLWALNLCKLKFVNLWKFVCLRIFFGEQDGVVSFMETEFKFVGFKIH